MIERNKKIILDKQARSALIERCAIKIWLVLPLAWIMACGPAFALADSKSEKAKEYEVKAAFVYNFFKFVKWPQENDVDPSEKPSSKQANITIGVFGEYAYSVARKIIKGKKVNGRKIDIYLLTRKDVMDPERLLKCNMVYISQDAKADKAKVLLLIKEHSILSVGESEGFLESGGMINFVLDKGRVRFEINLVATTKAELKVRAQFLRLAKRIIKNKD